MEPGKLSFIPKKSSKSNYKAIYKEAGLGFILKAVVFLFILSVGGFGASYFYKQAITREIDELSLSLDKAKSAFDPSLVNETEGLMSSISFATELLNNHIHPSYIFDEIEKITHERVAFSSFNFSYEPQQTTGNNLAVEMSGTAQGYRVLAEQALIFDESEIVKDYSFSGFTLDEDGNLTFSLNLTLDLGILFKN